MASKSFLLDQDLAEARVRLRLPDQVEFPEGAPERRQQFSKWLEERLLERLATYGDFKKLQPVLLGSWSRHELCPRSDIDLLFAGPEAEVKTFVSLAFRAGVKLRSRVPENPNDWSVGVEPFDVLALNSALVLDNETKAKLSVQQPLVLKQKRVILRAIVKEREERRKRQDSISNYLEPNLKFGAGGLRDIEQALALRAIFPEKFVNSESYPFEVLQEIKDQFLYLRCQLHLLGSGDVLSAHDQIELARELHMENPQILMKFIQRQLERASFYADWVAAQAATSSISHQRARKQATDLASAIAKMRDKADLLLQFEVRLKIDKWVKALSDEEQGKMLHKAVYADASDFYFLSLYRTRILEALLPDLKRLKGHVQHDHYHRFTADAHLVQTLREVQRAKAMKRSLGVLSKLTRELSAQDWWILKLTALFHDLAKGRKGDHSTEGAELVDKYFKKWGYSESLREEVHWLVRHHLLLSTAAFRQNPKAPSTWQRLFEFGVTGQRLILLALFTAIDIRATNPEAWTAWKSQLLYDLVQNLQSPQAQSLNRYLAYAKKLNLPSEQVRSWLSDIDPILMTQLTPKVLLEDLQAAAKDFEVAEKPPISQISAEGLPPKVIRTPNGRLWVRFHRRKDQTGLFLGYVQTLYGWGLSIQISSVCTLAGVGVYDWFCLRTEKSARQIASWLALPQRVATEIPQVQFQSIDLMAQDEAEWIISFRGRDQRGLLLAAAHALVEEKLSLRWARVHTWGQQIEDVFSVRPAGEVQVVLARLRARFVT